MSARAISIAALFCAACGANGDAVRSEAESEPSESAAEPEPSESAAAAQPAAEAEPVAEAEPAPDSARVRPCPSPIPEGMACVLGGTFMRGTDDDDENERPASEIFVSTFLMDTHEVTNAQYTECIAARVCSRPVRFPGYMGSTQPAVAMHWADADAYCVWREKRLPTEAEWERAATGPEEHVFPWGDSADDPCERAIVLTRAGRGCGTEVTWPVGSRAPNAYGLYDMAGNVWEWVADHYSSCYRGCRHECGDACFGDDPRGLCGDPHAECPQARGHRIVRGGSWWYEIDRATVSERRGAPGVNTNPHRFGFRCADDLP